MTHSFKKRLPKTTSYWIENEIFFIQHTSFRISLEEGRAIQDLVLFALNDKHTIGIVIDNRKAKGAWSQSIIEDSNNASNIGQYNKRIATLTNSAVTTMQMNRVAKTTSTETWAKAFSCDFNEEVETFIKGK